MENTHSTVEIVRNLHDLTGKWVGYYYNLHTNMETLKMKTEQLKGREKDINEDVNYKVQRSRKRRRADVELWQEDVRRIANDVQTLERQLQEVSWMDVYKRPKLGNRVVETIQEVEKLYKHGEFSNLLIDNPTCGHAIPTAEPLAKASVRNKERIWNFLMNDAVRKIGVQGMEGVGKTTIMKHINNELMEHINNQLLDETYHFSDVIWVTVSETFEIKNLQRQIAKKLNLNLSDYEDELRSASEIHNMLSQKKRYVLILDNLSIAFPLDEVELLKFTEEEALDLFMNNVEGHQTVLTPEVKEIAKEVAKKYA
ncbi:hypothetical protein ACSBR2_019011 [Camellia fascicularis]